MRWKGKRIEQLIYFNIGIVNRLSTTQEKPTVSFLLKKK